MKISLYSFQIFLISLILCSCTISSNQLESFFVSDQVSEGNDYFWTVNYDNVNYSLISVKLPTGTLFADKEGNSIYFDGWSIQSIVGFDDFGGEFEFHETEIGKFELNFEKILSETECSAWAVTQLSDQKVFSQTCGSNESFINKLTINTLGEIIKIEQYLMPYKKKITLSKID